MQNVRDLVKRAALGATSAVGPIWNGSQSNFTNTNGEQAVGQVEELPTGIVVAVILFLVILFMGGLVATYNLVPSHKVLHCVLVFLTGVFWVNILWLWYGWVRSGRIQV